MFSRLTHTADFSNEEKLDRYDYILFIIVFICPYTDSGVWWKLTSFIPPLSTLGSSILAFALSLYLFQYAYRHHYKVRIKNIYVLIWIAVIWSLFKFVTTVFTIGLSEAITIYRRNYILLPSFLLCMRYISSMSVVKMEIFARLVLKWLVILTILYLIQYAGINIFSVDVRMETAGGVSVMRNIIGLPPMIPVIFAFCFIAYLYNENRQNGVYVIICFVALFLSFTRNLIASAGIIVILALLLYIWKWGIRDKYKLFFYVLVGFVFLSIFLPKALMFWENLIDSTINSQLVKEEGTYAFRERLIDKAVNTLERHQCLWTGLGYIRDAPKGEYSFVLGTDTYVAPVLWCEGVIGIVLRCLPCFFLLIKAWDYFTKYSRDIKGQLALVVITSIVSQIPNYVQTSIFIKFNYTLALLYMIFVFIIKSEEEERLNTI